MKLQLYTDGSIRHIRRDNVVASKFGYGGFGVHVLAEKDNKIIKEKTESIPYINGLATAYAMELMAVCWCFQFIGDMDKDKLSKFTNVNIYCDNEACVKAINGKNIKLLLIDYVKFVRVNIKAMRDDLGIACFLRHVKGHDGNRCNEIADKAAGEASKLAEKSLKEKDINELSLLPSTDYKGNPFPLFSENNNKPKEKFLKDAEEAKDASKEFFASLAQKLRNNEL